MTTNAIIIMVVAGAIASVGISQSALHLVIAASIIAPGFLPLNQISLGILTRSNTWQKGLYNFAIGYLALFLGALFTTLILIGIGKAPLSGPGTNLPGGSLVNYWLSFSFASIWVSIAAGIAGSILLSTNRSVLTGGVMIALVLIPTATMVSMGIANGDFPLAGRALLRWLVDVAIVIITALAVLGWKKARIYKRNMIP